MQFFWCRLFGVWLDFSYLMRRVDLLDCGSACETCSFECCEYKIDNDMQFGLWLSMEYPTSNLDKSKSSSRISLFLCFSELGFYFVGYRFEIL